MARGRTYTIQWRHSRAARDFTTRVGELKEYTYGWSGIAPLQPFVQGIITRRSENLVQTQPLETVEIRHVTRDDVPAIVALYNLSRTESEVVFDVKIVGNIFERLQKHPNFHYYVGVAGERVVSTFMLLVMEKSARRVAPEGIVENITVHPKFQRRGIGKQMMRFAVDKCKQAGCTRLIFSNADRNVRGQQFFETLGFRRHGYGYVLDLDR